MSQAETSLIRHAGTLTVELERLEVLFTSAAKPDLREQQIEPAHHLSELAVGPKSGNAQSEQGRPLCPRKPALRVYE